MPLPYREFLRRVASCISADGSVWFLTEEDYGLHPDLAFPWERWDELLPDEEEWPAIFHGLAGKVIPICKKQRCFPPPQGGKSIAAFG